MPAAVKLRMDYSALDLRRLAAASRHAKQSRRLLSLAAVVDGMDREQAARIGGMDRQTLRDVSARSNEVLSVPSGHRSWLIASATSGPSLGSRHSASPEPSRFLDVAVSRDGPPLSSWR